MKFSFLFSLLFFILNSNAQISIDSLERKANEFLDVKYDADSALKYYLKVRMLDEKRNTIFILDRIASCYISFEDTTNAIKYYKMILKVPEPYFPVSHRKFLTCRKLTSIFINQNNFKEAIKYIDLTKVEHTGSVTRKMSIKDKYTEAFCHRSLNQNEEAITRLFYLVFKSNTSFINGEESLLDSCSKLFVDALFAKYGVKKSKEKFLQMFYGLEI